MDKTISSYMSRARRLFSRLQGATFNTMANLFIIVNSNRSRFGSLANSFRAGNSKVVNADVDRLETLLEVISSRSFVVDSRTRPIPSALRGSAPCLDPTPVLAPKPDCPKTPAPSSGTKPSYPTMRPKWDEVTGLTKADKVFCACFRSHTRAQGCVPLAHRGFFISDKP